MRVQWFESGGFFNKNPRMLVERQNLTMRMSMRRFTRLTNAFSKKFENHAHSVAIHFMHYNFVRIHETVRMTPAMAAGVTDKLWELSDLVLVIEDWEATQALAKSLAPESVTGLETRNPEV